MEDQWNDVFLSVVMSTGDELKRPGIAQFEAMSPLLSSTSICAANIFCLQQTLVSQKRPFESNFSFLPSLSFNVL